MGRVVIGRDGELARIHAWLAGRAACNGPPALLVSGEAGVGKTALLRAVQTGPAVVLRASGSPWREIPFGVIAQIVPNLGASDSGALADPDAVRRGLLDIARGRPLVLLLDDLHWSDDATLGLLAPLIEALAVDPVAVLGAYRSDDLPRGHLLRPLRAGLRHRRHSVEVAVDPLHPNCVAELIAAVAARVPDQALVDAVMARTEGVPFFVEELTAALDLAGRLTPVDDRVSLAPGDVLPLPETVRDAILLRAAGLGQRARDALDVAAVIGITFSVATVTAVNGGDWPDELDTSGLILAAGGDERRFRHALTQEAIYAEVPWSRRRDLHLAVAAHAADPGIAAMHLLAGRDFDRACLALLAAAARQEAAHAHRDAARILTTALENWPSTAGDQQRLAVVDRLARCAELSGDSPRAVTSLRELVAAGPRRAEIHRRLAVQYELLGHWPPALAAREAAAVAFADTGLPGEAAIERLMVAAHLRSAASFRAALDTLDRADADAATAERIDLTCRIGGLRGNVLARMGRGEEGLTTIRQALDLALRHGLSTPAAEIYQRLADSLEHASDYRAATRAYETAYGFCELHNHAAIGQLCQACATVVMFQTGRWDRAAALCTGVLAEAAAPHARAVAAGVLGLVHAMRGQTAPARAALLDSRTTARRIELVAMEILATWGLALIDEASGHPARATASYRHVLSRSQETEERHYCVPVLQFAAANFAACGARTDLGAVTAVLADAAAGTGNPDARAAFSHALGECALADSDPVGAASHLRRAVELLDGLDLPVPDILVRHRLGVALVGTDEGHNAMREARRTAHRLKARALADRIGRDLDSAPAAAHTLLTERELQIMRLVGEGQTSRAIASQLFLSVRTVEMHVGNAITKLGSRTRAEAVRRLATHEVPRQ
jgi:DNA-binding CsgD family transcriptional regulator/tetratricopeptide (TPR) repeat protein